MKTFYNLGAWYGDNFSRNVGKCTFGQVSSEVRLAYAFGIRKAWVIGCPKNF